MTSSPRHTQGNRFITPVVALLFSLGAQNALGVERPLDTSDPSKLHFTSSRDVTEKRRATATLEWDQSAGGDYSDRMVADAFVFCGANPTATITHHVQMKQATKDGFWPSALSYVTQIDDRRREFTEAKLSFVQDPNTHLSFATISKKVAIAPHLADFCGPDGLARTIDLQTMSTWNAEIGKYLQSYMRSRQPQQEANFE